MKYWQPYGISDPNAPYINGDPSIGRAGSIPPAGAFEQPQRELINILAASYLTPTEFDVTQVMAAVRSQRMNYAVDTGPVNALTVAFNPPIANSQTPGMPLRVKPLHTNTLPTTLIVDGVEHPLRRADGSELVAGDVIAAIPFECMWDDTGYWAMTNYRGLGGTGGSTTNTYITKIPYAADSGIQNAIVANFSPAITAPVAGDAVEVKLAFAITGTSTIKVNALAPVALSRPSGAPTQNGDGLAGQVALLIRRDDGTWQFESIVPPPFSGLGMPIGGLILTLGNAAPVGTLKLNGAVLTRSAHPGLWSFANSSGRLVDEAIWQNASNRCWTAFSRGDGSTNFRLPDLRGEFLRMFDDARGVDPSRIYYQQQADGIGSVSLSGPFRLDLPVGNPSPAAGFSESGLNPQDWISFTAPPPDVGGSPIGGTMFGGYRGGGITPLDGSYIRGNGSGTLSGGANETRPRNANVLPCVVDG